MESVTASGHEVFRQMPLFQQLVLPMSVRAFAAPGADAGALEVPTHFSLLFGVL